MKFEQVKVEVKNAVKAKLSLYIQESYPQMDGDRKRPMILICPGGGYERLSYREGANRVPVSCGRLPCGSFAI